MKILLVDDEPQVLQILEVLCRMHGYEVVTAETGIVALAKAQASEFDAVLSDFHMPQMTGFELFDAFQTCQPKLTRGRFGISTGHSWDTAFCTQAAKRGIPILPKPYTNGELQIFLKTLTQH